MKCSIDECDNKHYARGWCKNHYNSWYKHNDPLINKRKKHGYSHHPLYIIWKSMKKRCLNENDKDYKDYGGRGVSICDEWKNSAKAFIEWALPLWKKGLYLDRQDNDGNYCPENCHFVTPKESAHNRRWQSNNTSGYRGVNSTKGRGKPWRARISINRKYKSLGQFYSLIEAAIAYDEAAIKLNDRRRRNFL